MPIGVPLVADHNHVQSLKTIPENSKNRRPHDIVTAACARMRSYTMGDVINMVPDRQKLRDNFEFIVDLARIR